MSKYLTSFPGRAGDILWSLPTVRAIARLVGGPVDFCCMPQYKGLLPLLQYQSYIDKAFVVDDWALVDSILGDQPWKPPARVEVGYEKVWHLGFRQPPDLPLIDFHAGQAGVKLERPVLPFIEVPEPAEPTGSEKYIACCFNPGYKEKKDRFRAVFNPGIKIVDTAELPWLEAATVIKYAVCFVGCRSSNAVLAHGVNQPVIIYEPDRLRNDYGRPWWREVVRQIIFPSHANFRKVYGCPYGRETIWPYGKAPEKVAAEASQLVREMSGG